MINTEYLNNLNNAQKEAVLYLDGPLLIVAGAGSGKTKVLTSERLFLISSLQVYPHFEYHLPFLCDPLVL